jgi:23S rRNA pseudouridine1911/1915/1917 synthase
MVPPMTLPDILAEDDLLVAFDKPSGLPVSPSAWDKKARASLVGLVRIAYGEDVAAVHRLDTEASGVVLFAKGKAALDFLSGQFQSKTVRKVHQAMVAVAPPDASGVPPRDYARDAAGVLPAEFTVDLDLGADESNPAKVRVYRKRGGKPAQTEFRVLESFGRFVWLECRPLTGRTHQIRVHLAAAGAPVLYDALYGDPGAKLLLSDFKRGYKGLGTEKPMIGRLALHAGSLGFTHPGTREPVEVAAPLPKEFEIALKNLRKFAGPRRGAP